jgi:hypothetical protein
MADEAAAIIDPVVARNRARYEETIRTNAEWAQREAEIRKLEKQLREGWLLWSKAKRKMLVELIARLRRELEEDIAEAMGKETEKQCDDKETEVKGVEAHGLPRVDVVKMVFPRPTRLISNTEEGDDTYDERVAFLWEQEKHHASSSSSTTKTLPRSFSESSPSKKEKQQGEDNHIPYGSKEKASFQTQETEDRIDS